MRRTVLALSLTSTAAVLVGWASPAGAAPRATIEIRQPKEDTFYLRGQGVFLMGKVSGKDEVRGFSFEVDKREVFEGVDEPFNGVWDTRDAKPGKHELTLKVRFKTGLLRSKPVEISIAEPPAGANLGALCARQRQQWALAVSTFVNVQQSEAGAWLAVAVPEYLVAAAGQVTGLPVAAHRKAKAVLDEAPRWICAPADPTQRQTLLGKGREACLLDGMVDVASGTEKPTMPVTMAVRVWSGKEAKPVIVCSVSGRLGDVGRLQHQLANSVVAALELYRTPEEYARFDDAFTVKLDTYRALGKAQAAVFEGDWPTAEAQLAEAAQLEPQNPHVKIGMAQLQIAREQYDEALTLLEEARDLAPEGSAARQRALLWLGSVAGWGYEHYDADFPEKRWHCAQVAAQLAPEDPIVLGNWMELAKGAAASPDNLQQIAQTGAKVLAAQRTLPQSGPFYRLLQNTLLALLKSGDDATANELLARVDKEFKLEQALHFKYDLYEAAGGHTKERLEVGSDLIAVSPVGDLAKLVCQLVPLVNESQGLNAAKVFLKTREQEVWRRVSLSQDNNDRVQAATQLAKAWADLGDEAKQKEWAAKAAAPGK